MRGSPAGCKECCTLAEVQLAVTLQVLMREGVKVLYTVILYLLGLILVESCRNLSRQLQLTVLL
jgi:hypothetical protein